VPCPIPIIDRLIILPQEKDQTPDEALWLDRSQTNTGLDLKRKTRRTHSIHSKLGRRSNPLIVSQTFNPLAGR
jgi:hypothetical protein